MSPTPPTPDHPDEGNRPLLVEIFSKVDCCLCDEAKAVLMRAKARVPFELKEHDITSDPALLEKYGTSIPVVFIEGRKAFKYYVNEDELFEKLAAASARVTQTLPTDTADEFGETEPVKAMPGTVTKVLP